MIFTCDYSEARLVVADGDVVILRAPWFHSPLAAATRWLLRTPYTHSSMALWLEGGLWVSEMWGEGNVLVPLSQYSGTAWDLWDCPGDRAAAKTAVLEHMRGRIGYDWGDLARIAANRLVGWPLPRHDDARLICSAYTGHVLLEHCGWHPEGLPAIAAPSDLARALGRPKLSYEPENLEDA